MTAEWGSGPAADAKTVILDRIRAALADDPAPVTVPRNYERAPLTGRADLELFAERVAEYRANVHRTDITGLPGLVADLVGDGSVVVPHDLPDTVTGSLGVRRDGPGDRLTVQDLDRTAAVITNARLGIALTGTIVLDAGPGQGRRALTLVPDHHVCVLFADQIVDTVPQAFSALTTDGPLTFISGPSATSDIELNRVEGVHGPRRLDVVLVER